MNMNNWILQHGSPKNFNLIPFVTFCLLNLKASLAFFLPTFFQNAAFFSSGIVISSQICFIQFEPITWSSASRYCILRNSLLLIVYFTLRPQLSHSRAKCLPSSACWTSLELVLFLELVFVRLVVVVMFGRLYFVYLVRFMTLSWKNCDLLYGSNATVEWLASLKIQVVFLDSAEVDTWLPGLRLSRHCQWPPHFWF